GRGSGGRRGRRQRLERKGEIVGRLEAQIRRLLEAAPDDPVERRRNGEPRRVEIRGLPGEDRRNRVGGGLASERPLAAQQLVEEGTEREDVRAVVDCEAAHLL